MTETAMQRVWSDILMAAGEQLVTLLGLLVLSAAFDCTDRSMLLDRLRFAVVLSDSVLDLVRSFLTDRTQQIAYSGQLSAVQPVLFGVLQGPILGLLNCIFSTQLCWASLLPVMASTCTSMPLTCRSMSALRPGMLIQPSQLHISLRVSSTSTTKTQVMWLGSPQQLAQTVTWPVKRPLNQDLVSFGFASAYISSFLAWLFRFCVVPVVIIISFWCFVLS